MSRSADLMTLSWCIGEIREGLDNAERLLAEQLQAEADDDRALKSARLALHQVHGALSMIDIPGALVITLECEEALAAIAEHKLALDDALLEGIGQAMTACTEYLDDLVQERPDQPLYLLPYLQALRIARGAAPALVSDLYFPDLERRVPADGFPEIQLRDGSNAGGTLVIARKTYEQGLLRYLREPGNQRGVEYMLSAALGAAGAASLESVRSFWRVVAAYLEALRAGSIAANDPQTKHLLAAFNMQLRRALDTGANVSDKVFRDTLHAIAQARPETPMAQRVRKVFRLDSSIPADLETLRYVREDSAAMRGARETLTQAQGAWDRISRGQHSDYAVFLQSLASLDEALGRTPINGLRPLIQALVQVAQRSGQQASGPAESIGVEVATALLFIGHVFDQGARAGGEAAAQAKELAQRLLKIDGEGGEPPPLPAWLQDLSRSAQERLTMVTFIGELRGSLKQIETQLDGFFRDSSDRKSLPDTIRELHRVAGALNLLGYADAAAGAQAAAGRVGQFASLDGEVPEPSECERVAASLGALGFFVEGLQQPERLGGQFEFDARTGEFKAHFAPRIESPAAPVADSVARPAVGQTALDTLTSTLADLGASFDPPVQEPAAAEPAPVSESPSADSEIDGELLEIFLAEATEVIETIQERLTLSRRAPSDIEHLTTMRRGFHTLKGSSRMVGLTAFGEAGWAMEQVLNQWLASERPGSNALYALIESSLGDFGVWTARLSEDASSAIATEALVRRADAFRAGDETVEDVPVTVEALPVVEEVVTIGEPTVIEEPVMIDEPAMIEESVEIGEPAAIEEAVVFEELVAMDEAAEVEEAVLIEEPLAVDEAVVFDEIAVIEEPISMIEESVEIEEPVLLSEPEVVDLPSTIESPLLVEESVQPSAVRHSIDALLEFEDLADVPVDSGSSPDFNEFSKDIDGALVQITAFEPTEERDTVAESAAVEEASVPDELTIGSISVSGSLYSIFLEEADALIDTLAASCEVWRTAPSRPASPDLWRAVHSLAGSASVVGLGCVHDVAEQIESLFQAQVQNHRSMTAIEFDLIEQAAARARAMLTAFSEARMPEADPALVSALRERVELFLAPEAVGQPDISISMPEAAPVEATLEQDEPDDVELPGWQPPVGLTEQPAEPIAGIETTAAEVPAAAPPLPELVDELDPELLPIFVEEADDYMPRIAEDLRRYAQAPGDSGLARELLRAMHTVKGSARMAGAMALGQQMHEMENRIEALSALGTVPPGLIEDLIADHDQAVAMFEAIKSPAAAGAAEVSAETTVDRPADGTVDGSVDGLVEPPAQRPPVPSSIGAAGRGGSEVAAALTAEDAAEPVASAPAIPSATPSATSAKPFDAQNHDAGALAALASAMRGLESSQRRPPSTSKAAAKPAEEKAAPAAPLVRVRADLLDRVVNDSGEVSIARSKLETELTTLRQSLADLTENVSRLRTQLREIEMQAESQIQASFAQQRDADRNFDPLEFDRYTRLQELTRLMAESVSDVATVQQNASRTLDSATQGLVRQGQVLRDLHQNLMRVRMVRFGTASDRLYRIARQAAKETGKRVNLDVRGSAVELDRNVLERMVGPMEHLLRNAVAHGIEAREDRVAAGKPETGEIGVDVRQEGSEIIIEFSDDGAGMNLEKIRARGIERGLIAADAEVSDQDLRDLIFMPGFSTAAAVTELSGRGVGMDVVRFEANALGGRVEIDSTFGTGTRFTIRLPLTLAVAQVVLADCGASRYAMLSSAVEQVLQLKPQTLAAGYGQGHIDWQGHRLPLFYLGHLFDRGVASPVAQHYSPVVVLRSGNQRIALHVDTVSRNQEVVVKNVGVQVARLQGISGATVLGSGEIVLIINPVTLAELRIGAPGETSSASPVTAAARERGQGRVMVVDDSVTVRKVTQRLLDREGYEVLLAKDGVDALRQIQDELPDVMLVDIEMPRMDGFDLTRAIRADERLRHIPIVMISSRTADKHRNLAMELGVNAFLGKPYAEDQLLELISSFRERAMAASMA